MRLAAVATDIGGGAAAAAVSIAAIAVPSTVATEDVVAVVASAEDAPALIDTWKRWLPASLFSSLCRLQEERVTV